MDIVLLTGATSSIGVELAMHLSDKYVLLLAGRSGAKLMQLKEKLGGKGHLIWECDFVEPNISKSFETFLAVNNVKPNHYIHVGGEFAVLPIRLVYSDFVSRLFQVNVFAAIDILSVLSKRVYKRDLKSVVFFSSIATKRGFNGYSVYSAAKSALLGLTKSLSLELSPVKVNVLTLGPIITSATSGFGDNEINKGNGLNGDWAEASVLNEWVGFLLEKNNWMTGQEIVLDGGLSVR
jgi:short-subunit dehydrogenase